MSSASGDFVPHTEFVPRPPTRASPLDPTGTSVPQTPFCGVKKILKLYSDVLCGLSVTAVFLVHLYAFNQLKPLKPASAWNGGMTHV